VSAALWVCLLTGLVALWAWREAVEVEFVGGDFAVGVCWELALVALAASAACGLSLWNA
jgi:hypothetical protein